MMPEDDDDEAAGGRGATPTPTPTPTPRDDPVVVVVVVVVARASSPVRALGARTTHATRRAARRTPARRGIASGRRRQ